MARLPSLHHPPLGFAHRGARAHAPENTIEAFELALRLGAPGLESDVWLTADGEAVLDHNGVVGRLRRRPISALRRAELPEHIPTVAELYARCGGDFALSIDIKDPAAAPALVSAAVEAGATARLWMCSPDAEALARWRGLDRTVHLVHSTDPKALRRGLELHGAHLAAIGVEAINFHHSEWSGGRVALFHRFGILAFGWDAQYERVLHKLLGMGIDAVYSDHTDRLVTALDGR